MDEIPAFAAALLSRLPPGSPLSQSLRSSSFSPLPSTRSPEESILRAHISDLESQLSILSLELSDPEDLKAQADDQARFSSELAREVAVLEAQVANEETITYSLNERIAQLEFLLMRKQTLIDSKDSIIMQLRSEYTSLQEEYERALEMFADDVRQRGSVSRFGNAASEERLADRFGNAASEGRLADRFGSFEAPTAEVAAEEERVPFEAPITERVQTVAARPWVGVEPELRMFTRPFVQSPVHRALQDNISFGDEPVNRNWG
jgi:hypothetical protein